MSEKRNNPQRVAPFFVCIQSYINISYNIYNIGFKAILRRFKVSK